MLKEKREPSLDANPNMALDNICREKDTTSEKEEEDEEEKKVANIIEKSSIIEKYKKLPIHMIIKEEGKKVEPIEEEKEEKKKAKVDMHDKATQTEKIDFQKAKLKAKLIAKKMHTNPELFPEETKSRREMNDGIKASEFKSLPIDGVVCNVIR